MSAPAGPIRVRLLVAYDGSGFRGFAPNPGVATVGGTLAAALRRVLGHPVSLTCAGRTDAGVHARGQVISFDAINGGIVPGKLQASLNGLCGPAIVVREVEVADDGFDARFDAVSRTYRYRILNTPLADPLRRLDSWHVSAPLDVAAMSAAAETLEGEHDFASFCRRKTAIGDRGHHVEASRVRRVLATRWERDDDMIWFEIAAGSFCQQMVRSIVGTLVEVGCGEIPASDIPAVIEARDRDAAGPVAPPHGLTLWSVGY